MLNKLLIWFVYVFIVFASLSYLRAEEPQVGSKVSINQDIELELIDKGIWIHNRYLKYPPSEWSFADITNGDTTPIDHTMKLCRNYLANLH